MVERRVVGWVGAALLTGSTRQDDQAAFDIDLSFIGDDFGGVDHVDTQEIERTKATVCC